MSVPKCMCEHVLSAYIYIYIYTSSVCLCVCIHTSECAKCMGGVMDMSQSNSN